MEDEVLLCSVSDMEGQRKKRLTVNDRDIVLIRAKEKFYALDSFCYHAGGPLYKGDIEELGGRMCLVCPWHKYKVCIDTGQNYYQSVDPHNIDIPPKWTAGDVRQRTHKVTVRDGNIFAVVTAMDGTLDSDLQNKRRKVRQRQDFTKVQCLQRALHRAWAIIPLEAVRHLIRSMSRRCLVVIASNGGHTIY